MDDFFVMECDGPHPVAAIGKSPHLVGGPWYRGTPLEFSVPALLEYELDPDFPGLPKAMYSAEAIPLLRNDLLLAILAAGVDNLQLFLAQISDRVS